MEKYLGLISFLLSFVLIFVLILPKSQNLTYLKKEISLKEAALQYQEEYFSEMENLSGKLKTYSENLAKIDLALPKDPSMPEFLNFIQKTASQSGLSLVGVKLVSVTSAEENRLKENKISLTLSGDYSALKDFLSIIEKSARLIEVEQISFSSSKKEGPLEFNLTVTVYSY